MMDIRNDFFVCLQEKIPNLSSKIEQLVTVKEFRGEFVSFIHTFTYGELAIFILLFTWYLTYLLFKVWQVFR